MIHKVIVVVKDDKDSNIVIMEKSDCVDKLDTIIDNVISDNIIRKGIYI